MPSHDNSKLLQQQVQAAYKNKAAMEISGGGSKSFYGRRIAAEKLDMLDHYGVVSYEPTELTITARAGTALKDIETILDKQNQMLAFEPPYYNDSATLGGTIACNLSGPRRAYAGAARDYVLGSRIINGKGEILSFGGEVMKNVAGYDVSRLMTGAMGTLGVLLEVSLKVLPKTEMEATLVQQLDENNALKKLHDWSRSPVPISASCYVDGRLYLRLCGTQRAVRAATDKLGGDVVSDAGEFWRRIREQQHDFFAGDGNLWRLSLASDAPVDMGVGGNMLYEWGGALRWLKKTGAAADVIRQAAQTAGGHATCYRCHQQEDVFHPLPGAMLAIHKKLKHAFDPAGILNPGRMYNDI